MNIVTIIQARMGSTRLPGKVMRNLGGDTVLSCVVRRVRRAQLTGEVIIATTTAAQDEVIIRECRRLSVDCFRGSEEDVLDRYYRAARGVRADAVIRITSDCPLIEPEITDKTIRAFLDSQPDYASNAGHRTYPRGLDTEVMTFEALAGAWERARAPYQRAHVTPYIYENPGQFKLLSVAGDTDYSGYRWTLDTPEDLAFLGAVYERLDNDDSFSWTDVLTLLEQEPELVEINSSVLQKALQEG